MGKKFTAKQLMDKTMPFIWAKLILRLIAVGIIAGMFALVILAVLSERLGVGYVLFIAALIAAPAIYYFMVRFLGYAVRVGHVAVLTETIKTGVLPSNQVEYGKNKVVERIGTAATFFFINKVVDRAVQQLQATLQSITGLLGALPGGKTLVSFGKTVLKVALKYVDECCIAWIFYGPAEQSAWKGALDGVTIYAQNWKKILGSAVKTAAMVMVLTFVLGVLIALIFVLLIPSAASSLWSFYAFIVGIFIAFAFKQAVIDSWVMIKMLVTFLEVAPSTDLRVDLYGKLGAVSPAFRSMIERAQGEINGDPFAAPRAPLMPPLGGGRPTPSIIFCGQCGAKNSAGTKFCGECGQQV